MSLEPVILNKLNFTSKSIYSAAAFSLISQNISESSVDDAFMLADRRNVFDELAYDLTGLNLANNTSATVFESLSDSTAIASNLTLVNYVNDSSYLIEKFKDSTVAKEEFGEKHLKSLHNIEYLKHKSTVLIDYCNGNPYAFTFSSDGTRAYFLQTSTDTIYSFTLSTAWDLNTLVPDNLLFVCTGGVTTPIDLQFSSDGTKMFVSESEGYIYQYNLSTAWDITTATYLTNRDIRSQAPVGNDPYFCFSSDGTKLYVLANDKIYRYNLGNAWSLAASFTYVNSFSVPNSNNSGLAISSSGNTFIFAKNGTVYQVNLTTAYDLTTATNTTKTINNTTLNSPSGYKSVRYSADGSKFFGLTTTFVFKVDLTSNWNLNLDRNQKTITLGQDTQPSGFTFSADGTKLYVVGTNSDRVRQYELSVAWDITTATYPIERFVSISSVDSAANFIQFKPDGLKMYIGGANNDRVYEYTLSTAWDVSTATYIQSSNSIVSQEATSTAAVFKSDGTRLYIVGITNDRLLEYSLTTAWDVSTLTYTGNSILLNSPIANPYGIGVSSDGTKFIVYNSGGSAYTINLVAPWDLSSYYWNTEINLALSDTFATIHPEGTFTYSRNGTTFKQVKLHEPWEVKVPSLLKEDYLLTNGGLNVIDFDFSPDGTKLFVLTSNTLQQYVVKIPFNASTAIFLTTINHSLTSPKGLKVANDGLKLFILANTSVIYRFNLGKPFSIINAVNVSNRSFTSINSSPNNFSFTSDGKFLYLIGNTNWRLYKLEIEGAPYDISGTALRQTIEMFGSSNLPTFIQFVDNDNYIVHSEGENRLAKTPLLIPGDLGTMDLSNQEIITDFGRYYNLGTPFNRSYISDNFLNVCPTGSRIFIYEGLEINNMKYVG